MSTVTVTGQLPTPLTVMFPFEESTVQTALDAVVEKETAPGESVSCPAFLATVALGANVVSLLLSP